MSGLAAAPSLSERLKRTPFQDYLYSYPHKTAYRPLEPGVRLEEVWADERTDALFLYLHVPFCGVRCGFCNLFTASNPDTDLVSSWLKALTREVRAFRRAVPGARFARFAMGGGTPSHLTAEQLDQVFDLVEGLGVDFSRIPAGVEVAPDTATPDRLRVLRSRGIDRISMGVQSFLATETKAALRPQQPPVVRAAIDGIREEGFPTLNLDLIYGLPLQTPATWIQTLDSALAFEPEELFLYPLYVRPGTGLGVQSKRRGDRVRKPGALPLAPQEEERVDRYWDARTRLLASGFEQRSLRFFRRDGAPVPDDADYSCQRDGMVGFGVGARSYTRRLHYASRYAVGARGVRALIERYAARRDFEVANWGIWLDPSEQRRRVAILSLLHVDGLDSEVWRQRFGSSVVEDLPQLEELEAGGLLKWNGAVARLTPEGLLRSDTIGPWMISESVRSRMLSAEVS